MESARVGSNEFCFRNVVMEVLLPSDLSMSFFCWNPNAIGLDILRVYYLLDGDGEDYWNAMKRHDCDLSEYYTYGFRYFNAEGTFPAKSRIHSIPLYSSNCYSSFTPGVFEPQLTV